MLDRFGILSAAVPDSKRKRKSVAANHVAFDEVGGPANGIDAHSAANGKNPAAVILGRLGGLKGGKARAASLSKRRRIEIAKSAAAARWKTKPKKA